MDDAGGKNVGNVRNIIDHRRGAQDLLSLPQEVLETVLLRHVSPLSLAPLRATCRQLKLAADSQLSQMRIPYDSTVRHSFSLTCAIPAVSNLILHMPGCLMLQTSVTGRTKLWSLLPPATMSSLRRHFPGVRHLTISTAFFPLEAELKDPLDLSSLAGLRLEGRLLTRGPWTETCLNSFPSGLGPSLVHAAASLTSLHLSYIALHDGSCDVLGRLTGLEELGIKSCGNLTKKGLTVLGQLTRLTSLQYEDVWYQTGIPKEMAVLSALTRLRAANFRKADMYADEVMAWTAWGPSLTRLEMSSNWAMTVKTIPRLLPSLTSLQHLELPGSVLDRRMWCLVTGRMPLLTEARFAWVNLPAVVEPRGPGSDDDTSDEDDAMFEVEVVVEGGGAPAGPPQAGQGGPGPGQPAGAGAGAGGVAMEAPGGPSSRREELQPHRGLRHLRLDVPTSQDVCGCSSLWALLPSLEALHIGDDAQAVADSLADIGPDAVDCSENYLHRNPEMLPWLPNNSSPLRVLSIPTSWLQPLQSHTFLRRLHTLRLSLLPHELTVRRMAAMAPTTPAALEALAMEAARDPSTAAQWVEARRRMSWRHPWAVTWDSLRVLEVPRDLDLAALATLCRTVRNLTISQTYGDALLALVSAGTGGAAGHGGGGEEEGSAARQQAGPLPYLEELTLSGQLRSAQEGLSYHAVLLQALTACGVRRVRVTRRSRVTAAWWAGVRNEQPAPVTPQVPWLVASWELSGLSPGLEVEVMGGGQRKDDGDAGF